uniref:carnosine N-methyltransferase n=1 Tax=Dermatophagoides pteronyssinus TaxID=6956 RepID=A0A6P6XXH0_DERPT
AREWAAVLAEERKGCFEPLLDALLQHFPDHLTLPTRVLVPGSGLGRLMLEVAALGFHCQGCEYNYFNLLGANLMLNYCIPVDEIVFCPFMHCSLNQKTHDNRFRQYPLPDVCAAEMVKGAGSLNLVAGEFVQNYHAQNAEWDAVLTAFFIDTSRNVFLYVLVIAKITKPGGLWANCGPLLYHHSGSDKALNTAREVARLVRRGDVEDAVCVDLEGHVDLRDAFRQRRQHLEQPVVQLEDRDVERAAAERNAAAQAVSLTH